MPDTAFRNINICKGTDVIFIDYSKFDLTSPIVAWQWDFGDGNYSNEKGSPSMPISHTYSVAGAYTVSLTVTNQCGCSTTEYMQINVSNMQGVTITCPGVVCENTTYGYKVTATCPGGTWQVIGGSVTGTPTSSRLTVKWDNVSSTGFGYIVYNPGGSCSGGLCPYPVSIKIPVVKTVGTIKGPDHLCVNQQYLYTLPQWPSTVYNWTSNSSDVTLKATDQPNEIVVLPNAAAGTVTLTCNYVNTLLGCTGTATKTIQIRPPVVLDGLTNICEDGEFTYTLSGFNANTGMWKLVDPFNTVTSGGPAPSFSANFTFLGTYLLSVTGDFCPPEPLEIRIVPKPPMPESLTGPERICPGIPTEYIAGTIDANNIFTWTLTNGTVNIASGETSDITLDPSSTGPFILSVRRETKEAPHCKSDANSKQLFFPIVNFNVDGPDTLCPNESYTYSVNYTEGESYDWAVIPEYMGSVMEPFSNSDGQGTPAMRYAEGYDIADPDKVSVMALYKEWAAEEESYHISKGYGGLVEYISGRCRIKGVQVLTEKIVKHIDWRNGHAVVCTADEHIYKANKVVVTVPLGVLQRRNERASITFSPTLDTHIAAAQKIGFGSVMKVAVAFKQPFWKRDTAFIFGDQFFQTWWTQLPYESNTLTGWAGGNKAKELSLFSEEELEAAALASLAEIFNVPLSEMREKVSAILVTNWQKYEQFGGAYSYPTPATKEAREILNTPANNTIYFADEALYDGIFSGTVEAALLTAKSTSELIINRL